MAWTKEPQEIVCKTQAEFDACVKAGNIAIVTEGYFEAWGSASVRAWDSASVSASDSASVSAFGRVMIRVFSCLKIIATAQVVIVREPKATGEIVGGRVLDTTALVTVADWCEEYGIEIIDGVAILYKGLNDKFISDHGADYTPGTVPAASDWDSGVRECGGGLHFSPHPQLTLRFARDAKRFVACPVALADIRAPQPDDSYPNKVKARGCCAPTYEVDIHGRPVAATKAAA